jgi:predicted regulator of Ras-like GTPase activity (Roadblock/LC7/MglB family)
MKTIKEWQKIIAESANKKYPDNVNKSQLDRVNSIAEQLQDVRASLQVEQGMIESKDHAHQDPDHRIAALIADIFILAEMRNTDVEAELEKVLEWFNKPLTKS